MKRMFRTFPKARLPLRKGNKKHRSDPYSDPNVCNMLIFSTFSDPGGISNILLLNAIKSIFT